MSTANEALNEECGLFAVWGHSDAARLTYYGLHSLQHRGQAAAGIVTMADGEANIHKGKGLVNNVFSEASLCELTGNQAIGRVQASDTNNMTEARTQPFLFQTQTSDLAVSHHGHLENTHKLIDELEAEGSIFHTYTDAEVIAHLMRRSGYCQPKEQLQYALAMLQGAYALVVLTDKQLFIARDPYGVCPLSLGRVGDAYVVATETCAFDMIGAVFERDVAPGEVIMIDDAGLHVLEAQAATQATVCPMEYVYLARPDSHIEGMNVHQVRKALGQQLAVEASKDADIVTGVPDSGMSAAIGYAEAARIPYELGLVKNRYVGRTFIQPTEALRKHGVEMKLSAIGSVVAGRRVVVVDDSIVRGTTSCRIVRMLFAAGAKEVHVRVGSPPLRHPCAYGAGITSDRELIAAHRSVEDIRQNIQADSLAFLSRQGMLAAIGHSYNYSYSSACPTCLIDEQSTETLLTEKERSKHVQRK